jgi:hypothetical protein
VHLLSKIEEDINDDDKMREQMLVYLYGIKKVAWNGEIVIVHVDEDTVAVTKFIVLFRYYF